MKTQIQALKEMIESNEAKFLEAVKVHAKWVEQKGFDDKFSVSLREAMTALLKQTAEFTLMLDKLEAAKPVKTYGYDVYKMTKNLTVAQLETMVHAIRVEHATKDGIHLVDKKGRWKMEQVTWAIYHLTKKAA